MRAVACTLAKEVGKTVKLTHDQLCRISPKHMVKKFKRIRNIILDPKKHRYVHAFIKGEPHTLKCDCGEKEAACGGTDLCKAPRMIQFRCTLFVYLMAMFLKPIEKRLCSLELTDNHGYRCSVKGLNQKERAQLLYDIHQAYPHYEMVNLDASVFDGSVRKEHLKYIEHELYRLCNNSRFFSMMMDMQLENVCFTMNGIYYRGKGKRMSGDPNTSLGNTIINYCALRVAFGPTAIIIVDGDDAVVFKNPENPVDLTGLGFNYKAEEVTRFEDFDFCQSKPVYTPKGWVMCREPVRAISRLLVKTGRLMRDHRSYLLTVGVGEGHVSSYMPMLAHLAKKLRELGVGGKVIPNWMTYLMKQERWTEIEFPDYHSSLSFSRTFDISFEMISYWSEKINQIKLPSSYLTRAFV